MLRDDPRMVIAERVRAIAIWRRERFQYGVAEADQDPRNLRSAAALDELAAYVEHLPVDEPRLVALRRLAFRGDEFEPGAATLYELGRFRFHNPAATCDGFLDRLVELAAFDRNEHGEFGGPQVPGDDPWRGAG